jgi:hypothetical protein
MKPLGIKKICFNIRNKKKEYLLFTDADCYL